MKIIINMCFFLSITSVFASQEEYEMVPHKPKERIKINTSEGLYRLAKDTQEDWGSLSIRYQVKPSALGQYLGIIGDDHYIAHKLNARYLRDAKTYNALIHDIICEIRTKDDRQEENAPILNNIRVSFFKEFNDEMVKSNNVIDEIRPDYEEKKGRHTKRIICKSVIVCGLLGYWTVIGLFSWVLDHCHHPWD